MSEPGPLVGVVLVGHGRTASELLAAARGIMGADALAGAIEVDAGVGQTPKLNAQLCEVLERADTGAGVLMLVDLWGASPCTCAQTNAGDHRLVTLSGLNLAMLLKLAALDRRAQGPQALADLCADSGRRSVQVKIHLPPGDPSQETGT
ncbi:MAG: hypothetical protein H6712_04215 [Myxococcales bacterium]|nr:hypothetical protein [Myxococcales bacterium]MCB9713033.1 hypothetical protein [Myxococcales bacterium]